MERKVRCFELMTESGRILFRLYVVESEAAPENGPENPSGRKKTPAEEKNRGNPPDSGPAMTDAQKRYLFRILADQGIEGDKAYARLKEIFQVETLKEVSKLEASRGIERLLEEGAKGGDGHGSPF